MAERCIARIISLSSLVAGNGGRLRAKDLRDGPNRTTPNFGSRSAGKTGRLPQRSRRVSRVHLAPTDGALQNVQAALGHVNLGAHVVRNLDSWLLLVALLVGVGGVLGPEFLLLLLQQGRCQPSGSCPGTSPDGLRNRRLIEAYSE